MTKRHKITMVEYPLTPHTSVQALVDYLQGMLDQWGDAYLKVEKAPTAPGESSSELCLMVLRDETPDEEQRRKFLEQERRDRQRVRDEFTYLRLKREIEGK